MPNWKPVVAADGTTYSLDHLHDYIEVFRDSGGVERRVRVTFSNHCFSDRTYGHEPQEFLMPRKGLHGPKAGAFCLERHAASLAIRNRIAQAGEIWNTRTVGEFVLLSRYRRPADGQKCVYCVFYTLRQVQNPDVDFVMEVTSAYLRDSRPDTFGPSTHAEALALCARGMKPARNHTGGRPRPSLP